MMGYHGGMRYDAKKICQSCGAVYTGSGNFCPACKAKSRSSQKGTQRRQNGPWYDQSWRKVREQVLTDARIPRTMWSLYDVDHNPPYNPAIEPDHRRYQLIPRLHADHSRKTAREDVMRDRFGRICGRRGEGGSNR